MWVTFTYSGKEVREVIKIIRDTRIKVAFRTRNTIQDILKPHPQIDKYSRSGTYRMKCIECPLQYVGQTGGTFNTRYEEHIHDIKGNNSNTGYSKHILNTAHIYGTITDAMEIITTGRKGRYLSTPRPFRLSFHLSHHPHTAKAQYKYSRKDHTNVQTIVLQKTEHNTRGKVRAPGTHWIGGWVDLKAGLDDFEKRKFLTLPGLEFRPLGRPAHS
jgi:hypothetical protein